MCWFLLSGWSIWETKTRFWMPRYNQTVCVWSVWHFGLLARFSQLQKHGAQNIWTIFGKKSMLFMMCPECFKQRQPGFRNKHTPIPDVILGSLFVANWNLFFCVWQHFGFCNCCFGMVFITPETGTFHFTWYLRHCGIGVSILESKPFMLHDVCNTFWVSTFHCAWYLQNCEIPFSSSHGTCSTTALSTLQVIRLWKHKKMKR